MLEDSVALQHNGTAAQKVASVTICVETDQIAVQDTSQYFIADRKNAVNFRARKRRMEEEPDLHVQMLANLLSEHRWQ